MVARADIVALSLDTPLSDVLDFSEAPATRACRFTTRRSTTRAGMIHIRDFVVFLASDPRFGLVTRPAPAGRTPSPNSTCPCRRRES